MKVVEQAVRDYVLLDGEEGSPAERFTFSTAKGFLFNDDYYIDWGGEEICSTKILEGLDLDPEWLRRKALAERTKRRKNKIAYNAGQ